MEGNFTRDLWKICCWEMAKDVRMLAKYGLVINIIISLSSFSQPGYSAHEKAIYAALSGNIKQVHMNDIHVYW